MIERSGEGKELEMEGENNRGRKARIGEKRGGEGSRWEAELSGVREE